MTSDELFATGMTDLNKDDQVEIVAPDGTTVAGPLTVQMALCAIGDWIHLTGENGDTYLEGNMNGGDHPADISHLPTGWRFKKLMSA
jgi:hypothetical protein